MGKKRLPSRRRADNPPGMTLTARDVAILQTIYAYDGILSVDQIHRWYFPGAGNKRNAQRRLSLLFHNGYIQRPQQNEQYRVPEPIVWLDKKGAQEVALQLDIPYRDLKWRNKPRWRNIAHDVLLNECRHMMTVAASAHEGFRIRDWYGQNALQSAFQNKVRYIDVTGQERSKLVWPDGFVYLDHADGLGGLPFLIELDNATESNVRFAREKVSPNLHLMLTEMYQRTVGVKTGRVLVIMAGEKEERYHNIRQQVTDAGGAFFFLFTRYEWLNEDNILSGTVWQLPHRDERVSLAQYRTTAFQTDLRDSVMDCPTIASIHDKWLG